MLNDVDRDHHRGVQIELTMNILSAKALPKPYGANKGEIIDPFVVIFIHDPYDTEHEVRFKTNTVNNNGFNPVWNQVVY